MNDRQIIKQIVIALTLILTFFSNSVYADDYPNIELHDFWVVIPPGVARSTAGYGIIKNTGKSADTLLAISSNAGSVMLHKTDIQSGMARMIHMTNMVIEAGEELVLEPMAFHLMFTDLCPIIFTEGGMVTLSFEFEKSGLIEITVPLRFSWQ